jgi:hypothetical protein
MRILLPLVVALWACSATPKGNGDAMMMPTADAPSGTCMGTETSNLTGVTIKASGPCKFTLAQAAAGITIPYQILVAADVPNVVVQTQDAGQCGGPGTSGLIVFEDLSGSGQHYCLCDTGLCPGPGTVPVTIKAGTYGQAFSWDGKNWGGPSDTGMPEGPPFPAGSYTLKVSAKGTVSGAPFTVEEDWPITLMP